MVTFVAPIWPTVMPVHAQQGFDADVSGDGIAAQQAVISEAGKGKIAGSVVTERPLLGRKAVVGNMNPGRSAARHLSTKSRSASEISE